MFSNRIQLYKQLEEEFNSKVLVYVTGDRPNMSAKIAPDAIELFINQLEKIGPCDTISLYLYTRGGITSAAWNIINLLRMYCEKLQVIVPHKAHSAGTIISLGANEIVMTKQATLSPIDPSITTPWNPIVPDTKDYIPVSVEAVRGYLDFAKSQFGIQDPETLSRVFLKLTESVPPMVIGEVYRSGEQIKMLAKRLLKNQGLSDCDIDNVVRFLCSESGSHDYTINRREAEQDLKLKVVKPSDSQYRIIKAVYDDILEELQLTTPFSFNRVNGVYAVRRCLLESISGGSDYFITEGEVVRNNNIPQNYVKFEGWRHDDSDVIAQQRYLAEDEEGVIYETSGEFQL